MQCYHVCVELAHSIPFKFRMKTDTVSDSCWIRPLLPPEIFVAEATIESAHTETGLLAGLFSEEREAIARAVPRRQAEFASGRRLAHQALKQLNGLACAIPVAADRSPLWPAGIIGSITHSESVAAVAVTRVGGAWQALGIDLANIQRFEPDLARVICTPAERAAALPLALVFSAKESLFKCLHPLTKAWMDFSDAEIRLSSDSEFVAVLTKDCGHFANGTVIAGRWREHAGTMCTAICLPTSG